MKQVFLYTPLLLGLTDLYAQMGIGVTPKAFFNVPPGRTVLFGQDTSNIGTISKLIWYGSIGAFRAGGINDASWNRANVGQYSWATGTNTKATGIAAIAMGNGSQALGNSGLALGESTISVGYAATALGMYTSAGGDYSMATGFQTTANGYSSMAMGESTVAGGGRSVAMGYQTSATGYASVGIGTYSSASGLASMVLGHYGSTNGKTGSFLLGDYQGNMYYNSVDNQMMMRFSGGYILYSTAPASQGSAVGVQLASGGNAWQTLSDSTRKENFRSVDGKSFLKKISRLRLGSWNYKGQEAQRYRHYGPMAQDFFQAFGQDEIGTIGERTSINQADFDGVNLIAIQALIRKVEKLELENSGLRQNYLQQQESFRLKTALLHTELRQIKKQLNALTHQ